MAAALKAKGNHYRFLFGASNAESVAIWPLRSLAECAVTSVGCRSMLHSVLVPVGLKGDSQVLIERAGRLPLSATARLALLHALPKRLSALAEYREHGEARRALERARLALPAKVRDRTEVVVRIGTVESEIAEVGQRMSAELTQPRQRSR